MATTQRVIRGVNLIARQFECLGEEAAKAATAEHVRLYWAPLLKAELKSVAKAHPDRFSPIARDAISVLDVPRRHIVAESDPR